jgi:hypothetical protein
MSSNPKRSRTSVPHVHTTKSGSRFVRSIDVIRSDAGRREISLQMKSGNAVRSSASKDTTDSSRKSKS